MGRNSRGWHGRRPHARRSRRRAACRRVGSTSAADRDHRLGEPVELRERLVGKDLLHKSRQATDRQTGKKKVIYLPKSEWIWRDVPHLRILSDELANAVLEKPGRGAESFGRKAKNRKKKAHRVDLEPPWAPDR